MALDLGTLVATLRVDGRAEAEKARAARPRERKMLARTHRLADRGLVTAVAALAVDRAGLCSPWKIWVWLSASTASM